MASPSSSTLRCVSTPLKCPNLPLECPNPQAVAAAKLQRAALCAHASYYHLPEFEALTGLRGAVLVEDPATDAQVRGVDGGPAGDWVGGTGWAAGAVLVEDPAADAQVRGLAC